MGHCVQKLNVKAWQSCFSRIVSEKVCCLSNVVYYHYVNMVAKVKFDRSHAHSYDCDVRTVN